MTLCLDSPQQRAPPMVVPEAGLPGGGGRGALMPRVLEAGTGRRWCQDGVLACSLWPVLLWLGGPKAGRLDHVQPPDAHLSPADTWC